MVYPLHRVDTQLPQLLYESQTLHTVLTVVMSTRGGVKYMAFDVAVKACLYRKMFYNISDTAMHILL